MPYCKKLKTKLDLPRTQHSFWYKPQNGKSIGLCDTGEVLYSNPYKTECLVDEVTDYSFYYGYQDGHPCIFITFNAINQDIHNEGYVVGIELRNNCKGMSTSERNKSINMFEEVGEEEGYTIPKTATHGITYWYMNEIVIGQEYCIYLKAQNTTAIQKLMCYYMEKRATKGVFQPYEPIRYELDIRPTIRTTMGMPYCRIQKSLKDFTRVSYLPSEEI